MSSRRWVPAAAVVVVAFAMAWTTAQADAARTLLAPDGYVPGAVWRPTDVSLFKNSLALRAMHWTAWGQRRARGSGTGVVFTCGKFCATDIREQTAPVTVTLSRPVQCGSIRLFSRAALRWHTRRPTQAPTQAKLDMLFQCP